MSAGGRLRPRLCEALENNEFQECYWSFPWTISLDQSLHVLAGRRGSFGDRVHGWWLTMAGTGKAGRDVLLVSTVSLHPMTVKYHGDALWRKA